MKKFFGILFALIVSSIAFAESFVANDAMVTSNNEVAEMPELVGKYYIGGGGLYGNPMTLHLTDNTMEIDKEVLIELDLNGAKLTHWELNPVGSSISAYINQLDYYSGTIRFTPLSARIGSVVSFYYELEKDGVVKVGYCTFKARR